LKCGVNNCRLGQLTNIRDSALSWDLTDDCCYKPGEERCSGGNSCCTSRNKCGKGEGDCDRDTDCKDGLKCGVNNCRLGQLTNIRDSASSWDLTDDCCYKPGEGRCSGGNSCCTSKNKCEKGEGDCDRDTDCKGGLKCGVNNCRLGQLTNIRDSASSWDLTDDCCFDPDVPNQISL